MLRPSLAKPTFLLTGLLILGSLIQAAAFACQTVADAEPAQGQSPSPPSANTIQPAPRVDRNGDPLPPGAISRIGSIRLRHGAWVNQVIYTPDGKGIVSSSGGGLVRFWDAATGKARWRFAIDKVDYQHALAISPDTRTLAVLCDFHYSLVDADTGAASDTYTWPRGKDGNAVRSLAIAPDLRMFARGCFDATVRLYDASTGAEQRRIKVGEIPLAIKFSPDGKSIYVAAYEKPGVMVYNTMSGKLVQTLKTNQGSAQRLAFSDDLRLMAVMSRATGKGKDRVVLWDLSTGTQRHEIERTFPDPICGAFSPDGRLFAVGSQGKDIVLFDTTSGKEHSRLNWHPTTLSLAFAPDGKKLASGDNGGCIGVWNIATGKLVPPSAEPSGGMYALRFLAGGEQLLSLADGVYWWDAADGRMLRHLTKDPTWYFLRSVSQDGKFLAVSLRNGDFLAIDTDTGRTVRTLKGHKWVNSALSPDGSKLFSVGGIDPRVIIWDLATGKSLQELKSHTVYADLVVVSHDGRWLASVARDVAARGDYDIRLWETASGKLVHRLKPQRGTAFMMVFSSDSSQLVSVGGQPGRPNDRGEVQLWDVTTGKEIRAFTGHRERVECVAMTGDGRMIATGSGGRTLRLWEVASGGERRRISGHEGDVYSVDFTPDGRFLAAASADAPVLIWDAYSLESSGAATTKLTEQERTKLWLRLADTDAAIGFRAVCELVAHPAEAVAVLQDGWKQTSHATAGQVAQWLKDLDSNRFAVRRQATTQLEQFVTEHEETLRQAHQQAGSLEVRQRLEQILSRPDPDRLRRTRMLEVLEQLATAQAKQFLQTLAAEPRDAELSRQAKAGLKRLEKR